jgi:tetrahydromethanopterin S-methyltransferase subunit G
VTLRDEDVGRIGDYVKPWLREVVGEMVPHLERGDFGNQLLERLIRIEEELKAQRALMDERFGFMADRFTAVDKRFEAVDKRFEAVDKRFEDLIGQMNARFGAMDKRFEDMVGQMNARFETVDRRFEESRAHTDSRFTTLTWMIGVGFAVITSLTTLFALLA